MAASYKTQHSVSAMCPAQRIIPAQPNNVKQRF